MRRSPSAGGAHRHERTRLFRRRPARYAGAVLRGTLAPWQIDAALPQCAGLAFCGTSPPGADDLYLRVTERLVARGEELRVKLMLDGYKGVRLLLETGRVDVLKLNAFELQQAREAPRLHTTARLASRPGVRH